MQTYCGSSHSCRGVRGHGQSYEQVEVQRLAQGHYSEDKHRMRSFIPLWEPQPFLLIYHKKPHKILTLTVPSAALFQQQESQTDVRDLSASVSDQYSPEGARRVSSLLLSPCNLPAACPSVAHFSETESEKLRSYGDQGPRFVLNQLLQLHAGICVKNLLIEVYLLLFLKHRWFDTEN